MLECHMYNFLLKRSNLYATLEDESVPRECEEDILLVLYFLNLHSRQIRFSVQFRSQPRLQIKVGPRDVDFFLPPFLPFFLSCF